MPPSQTYSVSHSELQRDSTSSEGGVAHPRASSPMSNTVEPPLQQGTVDRKSEKDPSPLAVETTVATKSHWMGPHLLLSLPVFHRSKVLQRHGWVGWLSE